MATKKKQPEKVSKKVFPKQTKKQEAAKKVKPTKKIPAKEKKTQKRVITSPKQSRTEVVELQNPFATIDWRHSWLSLLLGILFVLLIAGFILNGAKGKMATVPTVTPTPISVNKLH